MPNHCNGLDNTTRMHDTTRKAAQARCEHMSHSGEGGNLTNANIKQIFNETNTGPSTLSHLHALQSNGGSYAKVESIGSSAQASRDRS